MAAVPPAIMFYNADMPTAPVAGRGCHGRGGRPPKKKKQPSGVIRQQAERKHTPEVEAVSVPADVWWFLVAEDLVVHRRAKLRLLFLDKAAHHVLHSYFRMRVSARTREHRAPQRATDARAAPPPTQHPLFKLCKAIPTAGRRKYEAGVAAFFVGWWVHLLWIADAQRYWARVLQHNKKGDPWGGPPQGVRERMPPGGATCRDCPPPPPSHHPSHTPPLPHMAGEARVNLEFLESVGNPAKRVHWLKVSELETCQLLPPDMDMDSEQARDIMLKGWCDPWHHVVGLHDPASVRKHLNMDYLM